MEFRDQAHLPGRRHSPVRDVYPPAVSNPDRHANSECYHAGGYWYRYQPWSGPYCCQHIAAEPNVAGMDGNQHSYIDPSAGDQSAIADDPTSLAPGFIDAHSHIITNAAACAHCNEHRSGGCVTTHPGAFPGCHHTGRLRKHPACYFNPCQPYTSAADCHPGAANGHPGAPHSRAAHACTTHPRASHARTACLCSFRRWRR